MTTYQLLYLRFLQAQKDFPNLNHEFPSHPIHGCWIRGIGYTTAEDAARERAWAEREFNRMYENKSQN